MKKLTRLLRLEFIPRSPDLGLLALRLWIGLSMLLLHGWSKLTGFSEKSGKFISLFGLGPEISLALAIASEVFGSVLLVLGLFTRFAALAGAITMSVAFFMVHKGALSGERSGELAFIYLGAYIVLIVAGGGRYSLDGKSGGRA